ncbi:MAG: TetR/AcrR family transcriptional regulator [Phenylobacterium sp.]|uniref:TetR/AcrR family transcriptional regulator n=1 Tax=Phenylobacterium sp. TaxID=1871053 RepID=UPI0025E83087|nr:TetR/AcrR family transcriptional regulator [Phenylobacterium sp.]MCA6227531.1 TetR/AcrR family transcriptional regulator [Phenylobacterium sp.]MCA6231792.1 TetR/AcrR family transcriptional regulator [Phenylobacterium sp.]MCA6235355.1 TetR/AcrR family transcriptional regulator [Phenylobacterium sp.]MCA6249621.1 TetR/AcrR family transcriptional regulator [Phenylobacterium sp.]MCA6252515.1 TetR/AcrR family transcriptional regulator [Phenylobacterium sp.]
MVLAETRRAALERIARFLMSGDLSRTSLRGLALAAGLNDRVFALHFRSRSEVLKEASALLRGEFGQRLATALPGATRMSPEAMSETARQVIEAPTIKPYMSLWLEIIGAGARGEAPFVDIAASVINQILDWLETLLDIEDPADRRAMAGLIFTSLNPIVMGTVLTGVNARVLRQARWA